MRKGIDQKISVIIPVKNQENKIGTCLEAVFNQTLSPLEVIIVDGHSTDKTVDKAKIFPVSILYEDYHTRAGACQIGVESAKGTFVAFTDADCIPEKDWLENLIKEFDNGIVGVGGGIKNIGVGLWEKSINMAMGTFLGSANSIQGRFFLDKRYVNSISGCNSMYYKKDILDVGGFDPSLPTAEDTDLNKKLCKIGKLLYTPNAVISHNHMRGMKQFGKRMYEYGFGRAKARLWDLQVLPPISIGLLFMSLFLTKWLFLGMISIYILMIAIIGVKSSIQERKLDYIISIPTIFVVEHGMYTLGFWNGLFYSRS